jgi:hypothetical protein
MDTIAKTRPAVVHVVAPTAMALTGDRGRSGLVPPIGEDAGGAAQWLVASVP